MSERLLLRPEEAADVLGIGRSKLYELLAAGRIESVRIGSSRRVPVEGLHDYVQRLRSERELVDGEASTYATQRRAGVGNEHQAAEDEQGHGLRSPLPRA